MSSISFQVDPDVLRPIIDEAVEIAIARLDGQPKKLLWREQEVAELLGVSVVFLKEARARGEIVAHTRVKPIVYTWQNIADVKDWLANR